jgi:hypothetical protein
MAVAIAVLLTLLLTKDDDPSRPVEVQQSQADQGQARSGQPSDGRGLSGNALKGDLRGVWTGKITATGLGAFDATLNITGDEVGSTIGTFQQAACSGTVRLDSRSPLRATVFASNNPEGLCAEMTSVAITPMDANTIRYEMSVVNMPAGGGILRSGAA